MNQQNKFLLPDKSFLMALDREQRETLSSKYTILCSSILFTEVASSEFKKPDTLFKLDTLLNLKNIVLVLHWTEQVKMDLLTAESFKPMSLGSSGAMNSIRGSSEQELLEFKEVSSENIEMLKESEDFYRNLDSIVYPVKEGLLGLFKNIDDLSDKEWVNRLKEIMRAHQPYYPEIKRILKNIEIAGFLPEGRKHLQASIKTFYDTYNASSLENANQLAARLFNHDPSDRSAAHDRLQRLCTVFGPILTQEERTQIFNRFIEEDMPPIRRFAPYALGATIWNFTMQLYLRENPENAAPKNVLRDAAYLLYTSYKGTTFVSGDKWHRKFINEVPLFEGVRENFIFVDPKNKGTVQEGLSKIL